MMRKRADSYAFATALATSCLSIGKLLPIEGQSVANRGARNGLPFLHFCLYKSVELQSLRIR